MRLLKRVIFGIVALIAVLAVVGMFLPREIAVSRSIEINAPAADIFPHVNNLKATIPWSPWLGLDPEATLTFNDVPEGTGAVMEWASEHPNVGSGRMEVTTSTPDTHLDVALDFGDMGTADAFWDFVEADGKTTTTWGFTTDMGFGPAGRWMGLMMDSWVGADYQRGLENLKALVEGQG